MFYCINDIYDFVSLSFLLILNSIFLVYELVQVKGESSSYLKSSMNMLDMLRILLLYVYAICVGVDV